MDTDTFYVDATNQRVGIGTTSPAVKLHLVGAGAEFRMGGTAADQSLSIRFYDNNATFKDPVLYAGGRVWPWEHAAEFVRQVDPANVVLLGNPGPELPGTLDLRGRTTLAQAAAIIAAARCFVGIDSGLMWIAGSLQVPTIGLYGTSYVPAYANHQPLNPRAVYVQVEGALDTMSPDTIVHRCVCLLNGEQAGAGRIRALPRQNAAAMPETTSDPEKPM